MSWEGPHPPYRIETERLVLRCYSPDDAELLSDALNSSIEHLKPFLPWADGLPQSVEESRARLRRFRAAFDSDEEYVFGFFDRGERVLLGGGGLHPRTGPGGLEIGYWVRASAARQGIATEAAGALVRAGFEVCEADRIEIRIDPRNTASLGVPRKLGFVEEATLRRRLAARPGESLRDVTVFTLFRGALHPPPRRIETERLLLRAWEPCDAPAFADLLASSREHYARFIPFFLEGDVEARIRDAVAAFDSGHGFSYGAWAGDRLVGGGGLFARVGRGALEVGYHVRADETRRGYATEIAAALVRVAFAGCEVERLEMHIHPENAASLAVARKLGFREAGYDGDAETILSLVRSASESSTTSARASDSGSGG